MLHYIFNVFGQIEHVMDLFLWRVILYFCMTHLFIYYDNRGGKPLYDCLNNKSGSQSALLLLLSIWNVTLVFGCSQWTQTQLQKQFTGTNIQLLLSHVVPLIVLREGHLS